MTSIDAYVILVKGGNMIHFKRLLKGLGFLSVVPIALVLCFYINTNELIREILTWTGISILIIIISYFIGTEISDD